MKRLPVYSLAAGLVVAIALLLIAFSKIPLPPFGLAALGGLPLAAAMVDAIRLQGRAMRGRAGQGDADDSATPIADSEMRQWLEQKSESLTARERDVNARCLALQQWMQFPDAIDFNPNADPTLADMHRSPSHDSAPASRMSCNDPMARHDRELYELVERKTRELFDSIKQDAYRIDEAGRRVFDNDKIRKDLVSLVSDVVAIYRPGESSPLLKTNVEAVSRAIGRGSLRFLVAVESLPGGLAGYDFQSIYNLVIRAVKTFGMYKSAKPYLDLASGVLFAGRIVSSTNPLTLVAWWAASRATTYGASKLGTHLLDQQAVGLIRQLVEIVAIEVASIYSPMVRYRDVHWIYGVELVHLASELDLSDTARVAAMQQIVALNLRDEFGRVSLIRHLADGTTSRPANYEPSRSLPASDRKIVAERLESFLLAHVLNHRSKRVNKSQIDAWQSAAADRLEIQFRAGDVNAPPEEQSARAAWALASFCLQHLGDEVESAIQRLHSTACWKRLTPPQQSECTDQFLSSPPYLYHPPSLEPGSDLCASFLKDLVDLATSCPAASVPSHRSLTVSSTDDTPAEHDHHRASVVELLTWPGEDAIRVSAYFLRADANAVIDRYHHLDTAQLLANTHQSSVSRPVTLALKYFSGAASPSASDDQSVRCVYTDAIVTATKQSVTLAQFGQTLCCFHIDADTHPSHLRIDTLAFCPRDSVTIEKVSGYLRSDCRVTFPDGTQALLAGSTLAGYDAYFADLLKP